ncbi:hypothetical protein ACFV2U_23970 [Streptomyces sp. NPDC059697]|uniref:hypothetical protein n=1 Tax=Streptomyces sp. NPDC059697 TaxID=3346912 RepID=UPI0036B88D68
MRRTLQLGARRGLAGRRPGGSGAALPEFLTASVPATVVGAQLGGLPRRSAGTGHAGWDLPILQAGTLALVLLAATAAGTARLTTRLLIGPALRDGALHSLHRPKPPEPRRLPLSYGAALLVVAALGLRRDLLPTVVPPVTRHALLRLPGIALAALALGAQPPSPERGLLLAENQPYAERAPWTVLAPAAVLALLGALAVTAADGVRWPRPFGRAGARARHDLPTVPNQ